MGTNYYAVEAACQAPCRHCAQTEWHIGKSLCMFQAHDVSPWGRIESWEDWKRALRTPGVEIRDEYGVVHEAEGFIEDVEAVPAELRSRQYDWIVEHGYLTSQDFLDADGFSFCRAEFS